MADQNEYLPNLPPPPPEVKVRTLRSDLESMAKSGGTAPQFQNIKAPSLAALVPAEKKAAVTEAKKPLDRLILTLVAVAAVGIVIAIAYFVYQLFFKENLTSQNNHASVPTPSLAPSAPVPNPIGTSGSFVHRSLFKNPPDKFLTLTLNNNSAQGATDLRTYSQQIRDLLGGDRTSTFLEISTKGIDGHDFSINEIFSAAGLAVLDPQFLSQHFSPDPAVFVYRDKNGSWPGYILSLKTGENWLFLKNDAAQIEKSQKAESFFLVAPGTPNPEGFKDVVVSGQPARALRFSSGALFTYGWFRGYLILSTSEGGLKETLARL